MYDFNLPFGEMGGNPDGDEQPGPIIQSAVKDEGHPTFSSEGVIPNINNYRKLANSGEPELKGKVDDQTFKDIKEATAKTGCPADFLLFMCDWKKDITGGAPDAMSVAKETLQQVQELRSTLGRDPQRAEVFMASVLGGAAKVEEKRKLAEQKPEEPAPSPGAKVKNDVVWFKEHNKKKVKRKNREVYDFFHKRMPNGRAHFQQFLGSAQNNPLSGILNLTQGLAGMAQGGGIGQITPQTLINMGTQLSQNFNLGHLTQGAFHQILGKWMPQFSSVLDPNLSNNMFSGIIPAWRIVQNLQMSSGGVLEGLLGAAGQALNVRTGFLNDVSTNVPMRELNHVVGLGLDISVSGYGDNCYGIAKDIRSICKNASQLDCVYTSGGGAYFHVVVDRSKCQDTAVKKELPVIRTVGPDGAVYAGNEPVAGYI